jgi:hypothetical protein
MAVRAEKGVAVEELMPADGMMAAIEKGVRHVPRAALKIKSTPAAGARGRAAMAPAARGGGLLHRRIAVHLITRDRSYPSETAISDHACAA